MRKWMACLLRALVLMIGVTATLFSEEATKELPDIDALWDFNEPARTGNAFRGLLPAARESGNRDYLAVLLTQIARTQGLQREFEAAHSTLDDAEKLLDSEPSIPRIRYLLERGRVHNSSNEAGTAGPLFNQAWDLARSTSEDFYAVDAAHMLGICEKGDTSLVWNERAMKAAEASDEEKAKSWLGALYNNTGWTYHDMEQYGRALELFQKGLEWRQERSNEAATRIARWTVARALRSLGRTEEALAGQQALLKEHEEAGTTGPYVFEEVGECLLALGRPDEARPHFAQAYEELSQDPWLTANEPERIERLKRLGEGKGE